MGHPFLMKRTKMPLLVYKNESLQKYCTDLEIWLLLCDECSQPQEFQDGCFHFRTFFDQVIFVARLRQEAPVPPLQGAPSLGQCEAIHTALKVHKLLHLQEQFFKAKCSINMTGDVYSSSHHVKRPQSSSFLPPWPGASRARGTSCTGNPETCAGSFPPARREVEMWPAIPFRRVSAEAGRNSALFNDKKELLRGRFCWVFVLCLASNSMIFSGNRENKFFSSTYFTGAILLH